MSLYKQSVSNRELISSRLGQIICQCKLLQLSGSVFDQQHPSLVNIPCRNIRVVVRLSMNWSNYQIQLSMLLKSPGFLLNGIFLLQNQKVRFWSRTFRLWSAWASAFPFSRRWHVWSSNFSAGQGSRRHVRTATPIFLHPHWLQQVSFNCQLRLFTTVDRFIESLPPSSSFTSM